MAHELGHNLGSVHDGSTVDSDSSPCKPSDSFIMSPSSGSSSNNLKNAFKFSNCSIVQFKRTLLDEAGWVFLNNMKWVAKCIYNKLRNTCTKQFNLRHGGCGVFRRLFLGGGSKKPISRKLSYFLDPIVQNLFTINTN